jgi:hypothetical protein
VEDPACGFGNRDYRTKSKKSRQKGDVGMIWWLDGRLGEVLYKLDLGHIEMTLQPRVQA